MNWKKNALSYILWLVYAVLTGAGVLGITLTLTQSMGIIRPYGMGIAAGVVLLCGLLVLGVRKLWRKCIGERIIGGTIPAGIVEGLFVVTLLAVGMYFRAGLCVGEGITVGGTAFYDAATVEAGKSIPQVVHGASYLYLYLLHWTFVFLGNKLIVAVAMQMILQTLAAVLLYFAVRKLSGVIPGILMLAYIMLSPYMIGETLKLSPAYLFLCIYALVLLLVGCILPKSKGNPIWYVLVGVAVGLVIYLDVFGITLLLVLAGVLTVKREHHDKFRNSGIAVFLFGILGSVAGFLGAIAVDTFASGKEFLNVLAAWGNIYYPKAFSLQMFLTSVPILLELIILFAIMTLGIFSFWCRRHSEKQTVWIVTTLVFVALQCFGMMQQNEGSVAYLYICLAILSGVAVDAVFAIDRATEAVTLADPISEEEPVDNLAVADDTAEELIKKADSTEESVVPEAEEPEEQAEPENKQEVLNEIDNDIEELKKDEDIEIVELPKVKLLDNPLPLPKKHEPKVMDYKLSQSSDKNDSDFDVDVAEDDDFDI